MRIKSLAVAVLLALTTSTLAQFTLRGPGVDPSDFRVTTFASNLNYPVGMSELEDGSILVATSNGSSFFGSSSGDILRLFDSDGDGQADGSNLLVNNVPGGKLSSLRVAGDLVFTTGQGSGVPISIYRFGASLSDPLEPVGSLNINYPGGGWLHPHSALQVREAPGQTNQYELYFQLGSRTNFDVTTRTASLTSTIGVGGSLAGDAIHRVTITDHGDSISGSELTQIATGLRNAAGMAWHPQTGDLYLQDNGIDGLVDPNEPHSADELNVIAVGDVGGAVESFGFPDTYTAYRTNEVVGNTGIQPLVAFQPIDGEEGEGPNDIAFAPSGFPEGLNNGVFVGMHGKFSQGGTSNEENPLVFVDLNDNSYFYFIDTNESDVGHLDGLLSTTDSLFVADISPGGGFGSSSANSGKIYQIKSLVASIDGDFDGNGAYDCLDVDMLTAAAEAGMNPAGFDLTGDGVVDESDLMNWLDMAGSENGLGGPYLVGDGNLDGVVDISDFNIWNANKFTNNNAYCSGNYAVGGGGVVDVSDFNAWNTNKFRSSGANVVPEPAGWLVVLLSAGVLVPLRRRLRVA